MKGLHKIQLFLIFLFLSACSQYTRIEQHEKLDIKYGKALDYTTRTYSCDSTYRVLMHNRHFFIMKGDSLVCAYTASRLVYGQMNTERIEVVRTVKKEGVWLREYGSIYFGNGYRYCLIALEQNRMLLENPIR